jgi:hypothetical protein
LSVDGIIKIQENFYLGTIYNHIDSENDVDIQCPSELFLIDVRGTKLKLNLFGSKNACNDFTKYKMIDNKLIISMKNGNDFIYENGKFTLPKSSANYKLEFPGSFNDPNTNKKGISLYKKFPPYAYLEE